MAELPVAGCTTIALVAGPAGSPGPVATCTVTYTAFGYHVVTRLTVAAAGTTRSASRSPAVDVVSS